MARARYGADLPQIDLRYSYHMATFRLEETDKWMALVSVTMREAALKGLYSAALRTQAHIVNDIIPATIPEPVARGAYRAAWQTARFPNGAMVFNTIPYASCIEYGVRAENVKIGRKLIDALVEWIHMKGIGAKTATGKNGIQRIQKPSDMEKRSIAWAIAKSLQKKGIFNGGKGLKILQRAEASIPKFIKEEVNREIRKVFRQ